MTDPVQDTIYGNLGEKKMAHTKIIFQHPETGLTREAPVGYSWTVLFFGFFVPIIRFVDALSIFQLIIYIVLIGAGGLGLIFNIIGSFTYNKFYITRLITTKGYRAKHAVALKVNSPIPIEDLEKRLKLSIPRIDESSSK